MTAADTTGRTTAAAGGAACASLRILYVSQYFPPEIGATQSRAHDFAAALVRAGHQVEMLCEFPNHPHGQLPRRYRYRLFERDRLDGIAITRCWVVVPQRKTRVTRLLFYGSFMLSALLAALSRRGRFDLVIATSPPLPAAFAAALCAWLRRAPLLFEVRDPWPQAAIELGELSNRHVIDIARRMEGWCYRRARAIVSVSEQWKNAIAARADVTAPVYLIRNGANLDLFGPRPEAGRRLRHELGLEDKFVVLYIGLHGLAYPLETVLDAAEHLRTNQRIAFVLVGEGPRKAALIESARHRQLDNLRFVGEVERAQAADYFSAAHVSLVPLSDTAYAHGCIPLKLYESWACGCPSIVAGRGEAAALSALSGAGLVVTPADARNLADAIERLSRNEDERVQMASRGLRWVVAHANRAHQAERLVEIAVALGRGAQAPPA